MATRDWIVPGRANQAGVFGGTPLPVATAFGNLEARAGREKSVAWFDLSSEQIRAVSDFAALSLVAPAPR